MFEIAVLNVQEPKVWRSLDFLLHNLIACHQIIGWMCEVLNLNWHILYVFIYTKIDYKTQIYLGILSGRNWLLHSFLWRQEDQLSDVTIDVVTVASPNSQEYRVWGKIVCIIYSLFKEQYDLALLYWWWYTSLMYI